MDRNIEWETVAWEFMATAGIGGPEDVRRLAELLEEAYTDGYADGMENEGV